MMSVKMIRPSEGARIQVVLVLVLAAAVLGVAGWLSLPKYRAWKEVRFRSQAREFLQKTNLNAAWLAGQQALVLNSSNVETLRVMADIAGTANHPQAVGFRRKIAELDPSNVTNRLAWAQTALAFEQPPFLETAKALEGIPAEARRSVEFHFISAGLELKRGNIAAAEKHFESAIELAPTNHQAQINLAVLQLRSPDEGKRAAAQQRLESMRKDPATRLSVLRSLVAYCRQTGQHEKALGYSTELLEGHEGTLDDEFAHLEVLRSTGKGGESQFEEYLLKVQQKVAPTNPTIQVVAKPEEVAALAAWMRANDLSERALAWIQSLPKETQQQLPVEMSVADLYAAQKKWREMDSYLRDQTWGDKEYARHALVALALRNAGDVESSKLRWSRAVRAATEEPHLLTPLAQMVASWGWREEAQQVLWQIAESRPEENWAWQSLAGQYLQAGDTAGLKKVFEVVVRNDPKDFVARNNLAAAILLLNPAPEELARAHALAREVYEHDKKNASFVATYAYSLHLQGKSAEALRLFQGLDARQLTDPGTAVYYGLVLAATGEKERAVASLEAGAKSSLLPEERTLAEEALKRVKSQ